MLELSMIIVETKGLAQMLNSWKNSQLKRDSYQVANVLARLALDNINNLWLGWGEHLRVLGIPSMSIVILRLSSY
jgi:hypothetical protein